ncbi:MAG: hypothetical protein M1813_009180 [Trichoglossum hirsutum]|nr:MAG: hypothetical protein M1813_009180 [Trichoglossum hirsutum]
MAAANDSRSDRPGIRKTSTVYSGNDKEEEDDDDLPTVEDLLYTTLKREGFAIEDSSIDYRVQGVEEGTCSIDRSGSASGDSSGGSRDDPIVLLGDDESNASSDSEVGDGSLRAESAGPDMGSSSSETDIDSRAPAPPSDLEGCSKAELDRYDERPRPAERKRLSSYDGQNQRKRKHYFQQSFPRQRIPRSKSHKHCPKSYSLLDQGSRVAAGSSAKGRLPSLAPSALQSMDIEIPSDCRNFGRSPRDILPKLIKVTFRPHPPYYCSFAAVIRDNHDRLEFSFRQLARLIGDIGHTGKIDDFTIKLIEQHLFL